MPAVNGKLIKDRAARLRTAGDAQVQRHLAAQVGLIHDVRMESPTMGRTAQFAEVHFSAPQPEGRIIPARIVAATQKHLSA
jgi:threonylcarbamoyladenosine tRNA methylthiotransferase MtaB